MIIAAFAGEFEWKRYYLLGHQQESLRRNCGSESESRMLAVNYVQIKHPKILNTTRVDCSLYFISPRTMPRHVFILCTLLDEDVIGISGRWNRIRGGTISGLPSSATTFFTRHFDPFLLIGSLSFLFFL
ncbi:hypothetical protein HanPI659440_Chr00c15g0727521 [Helianthus annuus]|nr:hypothetical protein HanPI659440_Chr00c15g0727521 [Helianthus annuus]